MRRDMRLVQSILEEVEQATTNDVPLKVILEAHGQDEITEHVHLLTEAGFLESITGVRDGKTLWYPKRLTWAGHEALDRLRAGGTC